MKKTAGNSKTDLTASAVKSNSIAQIISLSRALKIDPALPTVTEWAAANRYLPAGSTERPGLWQPDFMPYLLEIQENMHPDSPVRIMTVMKSTQSGATTAIENYIGQTIQYGLHNILYVISDLDMAKMRSQGAIDLLIDFSGLKDCIKPITKRDNQRKSGDTMLYREFSGGHRFLMTSYNSIAKLKSFSWDLIIMDELTEAPPELAGQGDPEVIVEARGKTIRDLKVVKLSTPSASGACRIYRAFRSGDQREYMIPCPRCGGFQYLEFMKESRTWGLYGDYEFDKRGKGSLVPMTARYKCKLCSGDFYEHERDQFMPCRETGGLAYWEPQGTAQDSRDRSYHVSAMMSPMTEWANIITDYLKTDMGKNLQEYKNFVITNEGWHFENDKKLILWDEIKGRAEKYERGKVPQGPYIITAGVDVHKNRLICQLVALGPGMEAWSFDHDEFFGKTADIHSNAWEDLKAWCGRTFAVPALGGIELGISCVAVDISYNPNRDATLTDAELRTEVNAAILFCKQNKELFIPVKGVENGGSKGFTITQKRHSTYDIDFYLVDVSAIKDEVIHTIDLKEGPGAVHFPKSYEDEYFKEFCAEVYGEDPATGKVGYYKIYPHNERWDTFIYAMAAAKVNKLDTWDDDRWAEMRYELLDE